MIHWTPTTFAWRLVCSAGRATFTTVLSMNAMLEARMVAARIQGLACAVEGAPTIPNRIAASSHGGFMKDVDALSSRQGSEIVQSDEKFSFTPARSGFAFPIRFGLLRLLHGIGFPPRSRLVVIRGSIHIVQNAALGIDSQPLAFL